MTDRTPGRLPSIPAWEKTVLIFIALYVLIVFFVFFWLGWSRLPFPL
ncbi:MAG TPA: hypothetical protein VMC42_06880 [Methanoregulaceae archaeon]|nr:hypothetical protein [Methanoregulaceae archaeon]